MVEKRQFTRIAFSADAQLICQDQRWTTALLDISLNGALVKQPADAACHLQQKVTLRLLLSDEVTEVVMSGHIAHLEDGKLGMMCELLDVDSASHLRRIVELNSADSDNLLKREFAALIQCRSTQGL